MSSSIEKQLIHSTLSSPILFNKRVFIFPLKDKDNKLVISLNHHNPTIFILENSDFYTSLSSPFLNNLRIYLKDSEIENISFQKNNTIVIFSFSEKPYKLIAELIPFKPNLILVDENNDIIDAFFLDDERIKLNKKYKINELNNKHHTFITNEKEIQQYFQNELNNREKEKYEYFLTFLNNRIKRVNRKIANINSDKERAMKNLSYKDIADEIYCLNLDLKSHVKEIKINDEIVSLDESKKLIENIETFYKIVKKAKQRIMVSEKNILSATAERDNYIAILNKFNSAKSEKEKEKIILESNFFKKKCEISATPFNRPYKINYNGTIIYFGKNASQNDYLTFVKKLDREYSYLHIKERSGSHIIIANKKPTEKELIIASNIALISSHQVAGEIIYTKKKNVRRGKNLGEAILKNYSTIKINNLEDNALEIYNSAIRDD